MGRLLRHLKPDAARLVLAVGALAVSAFARYAFQAARIADLWSWGFPFAFYETWGPCPPGVTCRAFALAPLLADLLFWYVLSVMLVAAILAIRWVAADVMAEDLDRRPDPPRRS